MWIRERSVTRSNLVPLPRGAVPEEERLRWWVERLAIPRHDFANARNNAWVRDELAAAFERYDLAVHVQGQYRNVVALPRCAAGASVTFVVAHYDSVPDCPGADDNASGVAVLLALARAVDDRAAPRTIRFVAFVNEEPPHFWNESMGSLHYAKACKDRGDDIVAMLSLESLGYYRDEPGSQKYPPIVSWFYPSRGDFVGFVGDLSSRWLVHESIRTFRGAASFPSEGAALPSFVAGVGWSDHWSFWQVGYPGVMVTDTAPFRNPHYHTAGDTPDTLDYDRLARVTAGLVTVVAKLAQ